MFKFLFQFVGLITFTFAVDLSFDFVFISVGSFLSNSWFNVSFVCMVRFVTLLVVHIHLQSRSPVKKSTRKEMVSLTEIHLRAMDRWALSLIEYLRKSTNLVNYAKNNGTACEGTIALAACSSQMYSRCSLTPVMGNGIRIMQKANVVENGPKFPQQRVYWSGCQMRWKTITNPRTPLSMYYSSAWLVFTYQKVNVVIWSARRDALWRRQSSQEFWQLLFKGRYLPLIGLAPQRIRKFPEVFGYCHKFQKLIRPPSAYGWWKYRV